MSRTDRPRSDVRRASRTSSRLARRVRLRSPRRYGERQPLGLNGTVSKEDGSEVSRPHQSRSRLPRIRRSSRGRGESVDARHVFCERGFVGIDENFKPGRAKSVNRWGGTESRSSRSFSTNALDDKTGLLESLLEVAERPPSGPRTRRRSDLPRRGGCRRSRAALRGWIADVSGIG